MHISRLIVIISIVATAIGLAFIYDMEFNHSQLHHRGGISHYSGDARYAFVWEMHRSPVQRLASRIDRLYPAQKWPYELQRFHGVSGPFRPLVIESRTGRILWRLPQGEPVLWASDHDHDLMLQDRDNISLVDVATQQTLWRAPFSGHRLIYHDRPLYTDHNSTVAFQPRDGTWRFYDPRTGHDWLKVDSKNCRMSPAIAPDGTCLALQSTDAQNNYVTLHTLSDGRSRSLPIASCGELQWGSPEAFCVYSQREPITVYIGNERISLFPCDPNAPPVWSHDGKRLAYIDQEGWLATLDTTTREIKQLTLLCPARDTRLQWQIDDSRIDVVP